MEHPRDPHPHQWVSGAQKCDTAPPFGPRMNKVLAQTPEARAKVVVLHFTLQRTEGMMARAQMSVGTCTAVKMPP